MNTPLPGRRAPAPRTPTPTASRAFRCRCGRPIFFRNDVCLGCGAPLGYDPELVLLRPLAPTREPAVWKAMRTRGVGAAAPLLSYRRCANWTSAAPCNWLLRDGEAARLQPFCRSCRLDRTVPDPADRDSAALWLKVEVAKRSLVSQLIALKLPVESKVCENTAQGVMFDLLRAPIGGPKVMTGHDDGLVTIDVEEADDVHRETVRSQMGEPYRTLIGHLRHEIGHYYWQRLVRGTPAQEPCRALFGDDRVDYGAALQRHYAEGAPPDWMNRHVSAYASAHPYEDWAETWAHYLHMVDALDTARSFGLIAHHDEIQYEPFTAQALTDGAAPSDDDLAFLSVVNGWIELTGALNELTRSMGEPDFYPFVLSVAAVRKLHFIHRIVRNDAGGCGLGGSPTGAGGVAGDGSSIGIGRGVPGGVGGDGDGTSMDGNPVSGGTGTLPGPAAGLPSSSERPLEATSEPPPASQIAV
ncbi:MAG: putative zinc-binding metallopeptidase [Burkholderiaceae bacterium]